MVEISIITLKRFTDQGGGDEEDKIRLTLENLKKGPGKVKDTLDSFICFKYHVF